MRPPHESAPIASCKKAKRKSWHDSRLRSYYPIHNEALRRFQERISSVPGLMLDVPERLNTEEVRLEITSEVSCIDSIQIDTNRAYRYLMINMCMLACNPQGITH